MSSMRDRRWKRFFHAPDPELLSDLYVPALSMAVKYDRCCAYFSSSALSAAARGFGKLIERLESMGTSAPRPAVRLIVNEELSRDDVQALTETGDLSKLEEQLKKRFKTPSDALSRNRLGMLAWLYKKGLLDIRVGIMRTGEGIVHGKSGIATDENGDSIVFAGSSNESAKALLHNYEHIEVSGSWEDHARYDFYRSEFDKLWSDHHSDVFTVTLPEALRQQLIKFAPKEAPTFEPSNQVARQKAAMVWRFIAEAPFLENGHLACDATALVSMWPHQRAVVDEVANAWPDGRLLCDEVGMGKTVEAIMVLRRLMAGRGVKRVLVLLPKGLLEQWQTELREKGGLLFPRMVSSDRVIWPNGKEQRFAGFVDMLNHCDQLLVSREYARTENNAPLVLSAEPWDLVILDEAHAARRAEPKEELFNHGTLLLNLLRQLQMRQRARGFLLLSATPMQTNPWEPWDLLSVLGEGGKWLADFQGIRDYYTALSCLKSGACNLPTARKAARLIADDPSFPNRPDGRPAGDDVMEIARYIASANRDQRPQVASWLRQGSPLARRMHRNTRHTLHKYHEMGMLDREPPVRRVHDESFDYDTRAERKVYESITSYIDRRWQELERSGKGFVMTIYRRRASSSPYALQRSLERRAEALRKIVDSRAADQYDVEDEAPEDFVADELPDDEVPGAKSLALPDDISRAAAELNEINSLLDQLRTLGGIDTKRDRFFQQLRSIADDGRAVLVFTEYSDTMNYIRDNLVSHFGRTLGCYSGKGGQLWNGESWEDVSKDKITDALFKGELKVLVCTDAASEGLNLQAAAAVINYDLPWNPSKVEQRIGRVDRIGQKCSDVRVVNMFLKKSVDDRVYTMLRERCGLFERFVGRMQPVLALAKKMLLNDSGEVSALNADIDNIQNDILTEEAYLESDAHHGDGQDSVLDNADIKAALRYLSKDTGVEAVYDKRNQCWNISASGIQKRRCAVDPESLEKNSKLEPLTPLSQDLVHQLADSLSASQEVIPLVVGSCRVGAFRVSKMFWISDGLPVPIESLNDLTSCIDKWDGDAPDPAKWLEVMRRAEGDSRRTTNGMVASAVNAQQQSIRRQNTSARERLKQELGRFLVSVDGNGLDLNAVIDDWLQRRIPLSQKLSKSLDKLGGEYPEWTDEDFWQLEQFGKQVTENQRTSRRAGKEIDAALADPRW